MTQAVEPDSYEAAAAALAEAAQERQSVRIRGAGTKLDWGLVTEDPDVELHSTGLTEVLEHNAGDLTAVLQAGVSLAEAQQTFANQGQMLCLDPPLGRRNEEAATIGGVIAAGDSGPLRHRYGSPRDLVLGMTVALSDGTISRSGGKVIKNVAGYDIAKLFSGSFGTLGMILSVSVRLHQRPDESATALGTSDDLDVLGSAATALARSPLQLDAFDVAWKNGRGGLLAACSGVAIEERAARVEAVMRDAGLRDVQFTRDDAQLWERQRAGQRTSSQERALVRLAARPSELPSLLRATERFGGTLVGRGALGTSYVELDPGSVQDLRRELPANTVCVVCDAPRWLREQADPWDATDGPEIELMRRIKQRFDPARACNPGVFVGGI